MKEGKKTGLQRKQRFNIEGKKEGGKEGRREGGKRRIKEINVWIILMDYIYSFVA